MDEIYKMFYERLSSDGLIPGTVLMAKTIGLHESIVYGALLAKEKYYASKGMLDEEGMFYSTATDLEENTALTRRQQDRAVAKLIKLKLITTKNKGAPQKKHFKITKDMSVLDEVLNPGKTKSPEKSHEVEPVEIVDNSADSDALPDSNSTLCQNQIQQNVEIEFNEMSNSNVTKGENRIIQNVKQKVYIKKHIKNIYKHKHIARSYPQAHERVVETWNTLGLAQIKSVYGDYEIMLDALIGQYGADQVVRAAESIKESDLLRGLRPGRFVIQFGWFLKPQNFVKVLEREYIDEPPPRPPDKFDLNEFLAEVVKLGLAPNNLKS